MSLLTFFASVAITFLLALPSLLVVPRDQSPRREVETLEFGAEELFPEWRLPIVPEGEPGLLVSPVIPAPIPFNVLVPAWQGSGNPRLSLRTSPNGEVWSEWYHVQFNEDWVGPDNLWSIGNMVLVEGAHKTNQHVQLRLELEPATTRPPGYNLEMLRLTFIDSTDGPTADELVVIQSQLDAAGERQIADGYPKPPIISREAWCTKPGCDYEANLEYAPVTHLIIHHTVSGNDNADWANVVRAIWLYHTATNGWRDIGYNYLIDPNGLIYEGHAGGDDVVGIHASAANKGSMGVGLLGTFSAPPAGIQPPPPMLEATVNLLAWKAGQREINVFESSRTLPNVPWGLPHLMGHRDVNGSTECPGDQAHLLIPWLREQVAERIGLADLHLYADEMSSAFTRSSTGNWYTPPYLCGYNNHAWYTWTTTNPAASTNWGEWRLAVPSVGRYRIEAYVPYCITRRTETRGATYSILHADGTSATTISHVDNLGLWTSLGEYNLQSGSDAVVRLTDLTETDTDVGIWFDALRLLRLDESSEEALLSITPRHQMVGLMAGEVCIQVSVEKTTELHAFEFTLGFPTDLLQAKRVTLGPFLGSSGRQAYELPVDINNATGRVKFAAYSVGTEAGPTGDGELAIACFTPQKAGTVALDMMVGKLSGPNGATIPVTLAGGSVDITSCYFADFNCDNAVDIFDVQAVAGRWQTKAGDPGFEAKYDVVPNGEIDVFDVQRVASAFGWPGD